LYDQTLLLAIDTSSEQSGIALYDGGCLDEVAWSACHEQTVLLLDEIDHQLTRSRASVSDLGVVAVATGPGRFNALRVGMSIAKGLVLGLGIPIVGISTMDAIAHPYRLGVTPVIAVIEAGRGRVVWRMYDAEDNGDIDPQAQNTTVAALFDRIAGFGGELCITGEIAPEHVARLRLMEGVLVPPRSGRLGRAAAVAELALNRWSAGDVDDPVTLEPVYLHGARQESQRDAG
jgi:tRNA threonylcarbamoyladenosine biosynthesis protein TsaB